VSALRARCPVCRTLTAVALGGDYECHACGRRFAAGLVRVPAAWGSGGEPMIEAAKLPIPFPEVAIVAEPTLDEQNRALAATLPVRPVVLGGCCCAHVGAVEGLAARYPRLAVVWFDAHGDLNTPDSSPSGNFWGMPLRMLLDGEVVARTRCTLLGARNLDPPEREFLSRTDLARTPGALDRVLESADAVYVAFDLDVLDPGEASMFMPEPNGMSLREAATLIERIVARCPLAGIGFTGCAADAANIRVLGRLCAAAALTPGFLETHA